MFVIFFCGQSSSEYKLLLLILYYSFLWPVADYICAIIAAIIRMTTVTVDISAQCTKVPFIHLSKHSFRLPPPLEQMHETLICDNWITTNGACAGKINNINSAWNSIQIWKHPQ